MKSKDVATKILFLDDDEISFEFRKCMAKVLSSIPPVELFHASDATEALGLLESLHPDVIVLNEDLAEENALFLDSLTQDHPPIVVQTDKEQKKALDESITYIKRNETIEGIHQTLVVATTICKKKTAAPTSAFH